MAILFTNADLDRIIIEADTPTLKSVYGVTLCAWVNMTSYPAWVVIYEISRGTSATFTRARLGIRNDGSIEAAGRCLDGDAYQAFSGTAGKVTTGAWHHIAVTLNYNTKQMSVYHNGVFDAISGYMTWGAPPSSNTDSLRMVISGKLGGTDYINGSVEDIRCYNRLLSTAELETIYYGRGRDDIVDGLEHRYALLDDAPGAVVSATSVKDTGSLQSHSDGVGGTPEYRESILY